MDESCPKSEQLRHDVANLNQIETDQRNSNTDLHNATESLSSAEMEQASLKRERDEAAGHLEMATGRRQTHMQSRPGFWARLFGTSQAERWTKELGNIDREFKSANANHVNKSEKLARAAEKLNRARVTLETAQQRHTIVSANAAASRMRLEKARSDSNLLMMEDAFFTLPRDAQQLASPWFTADDQRLRDDVFISAMALHKAFIGAAATPIRHNLTALMRLFYKKSLGKKEREGSRFVGVLLLVHRRCANPMFRISNSIAYSGLMVSATPERTSEIRRVLGSSRWIHVVSRGDDKWSAAEGECVVEILRNLRSNNVNPDLYIVTPFRVVSERLRQAIVESKVLDEWIEKPQSWTKERVGKVHTVQGRKAELVLFVLGAPESTQTGARSWAGWPPNLVNVAVTRAKEILLVIGNRELWKRSGCFADIDRWL